MRAEIARRIPHQGRMCLLDRVLSWDSEGLRCETQTHRDPDNPLRAHGRLGVACGIEYAAQAMAVHGSLLAEAAARAAGGAAPPRAGYLAGLRGVEFHARRLDDVAGPLAISVEQVLGDGNSMVYGFAVEGAGRALLRGRATVVLDAVPAATQAPPTA